MFIEAKKKSSGLWYKRYKLEDGIQVHPTSYTVWKGIINRCLDAESYTDVEISECFKNYQTFTDWYIKQVGYGEDNYHIDKDLLASGSRTYSENTCVLIPKELNYFLIDRRTFTRKCEQGYYLESYTGKFKAQISENGKIRHLGRFDTEEDALSAYQSARNKLIDNWVLRLEEDFVVDERVIPALLARKFKE